MDVRFIRVTVTCLVLAASAWLSTASSARAQAPLFWTFAEQKGDVRFFPAAGAQVQWLVDPTDKNSIVVLGRSGGLKSTVAKPYKVIEPKLDDEAVVVVPRRLAELRERCQTEGKPFPETFTVKFVRNGYELKVVDVPSRLFGNGQPRFPPDDAKFIPLVPKKVSVDVVTDPPGAEVRLGGPTGYLLGDADKRLDLWLPWVTTEEGQWENSCSFAFTRQDYVAAQEKLDFNNGGFQKDFRYPESGAVTLKPSSNWVALRDGLRRHALLIGAGLVLLAVGSAALRVSLRRRQAMERALLEENERLREVPVPSLPVLGDRWELGSKIGQGGSATVFLATDLQSPRREAVAVKILDDDAAEEEAERKRFEREVSISCRLSHPNIVRIIDYDGERDQPYLVMELLEGQPLRRRLSDGPLAPDEFRTIFRAVLDAMRYAHEQGVVHRDLKPENVILTRKGQPKIVDFGIARGQLFATVTTTGRTVGTFAYLPPERFVAAVTDDPRSDQYALGVLGYELLAGRRPWPDQMLGDVMLGIVQTRPEHLSLIRSDLPPRLPEVIERLMHLELEARYSDLREALEAFDAAWPDGV